MRNSKPFSAAYDQENVSKFSHNPIVMIGGQRRRTLFEAKEEQGIKKIGICNNKGGVGKTTFCFNLGGVLAEMGKKVLMVGTKRLVILMHSLKKRFF